MASAEFVYVISGGGTMIVGGTLLDPKPGGGNIAGSAISGGTVRTLAPGDMLFVPEGTPHWFSAIDGTLIDLTLKMPRPVPEAAK